MVSGKESTFFRMGDNFFKFSILTKSTFGSQGVVPLFSRSSLGRRSVELGKV